MKLGRSDKVSLRKTLDGKELREIGRVEVDLSKLFKVIKRPTF